MKFSLKSYNTFGVDARCKQLVPIDSLDSLLQALEAHSKTELFILGGGSNVLFVGDLNSTVLLNRISGIDVLEQNSEEVFVRVGAGVVWHDFVSWSVDKSLGNLENLALIPGTVGAAPMQNIGAYGEEVRSYITKVIAVSRNDGSIREFTPEECEFGYRSSIFKHALKEKYIITHVDFKLSKNRVLNSSYGAIQGLLEERMIERASIKDVFQAVIDIRKSKLPDPAEIGNAGSFFKNPIIAKSEFENLHAEWPDMVYYPAGNDHIKIPAGWLIDRLGWKGKVIGNTGCYENQALVIVNHGNATGLEIYEHAMKVQKSVKDNFGIHIEPEVNIIGL